MANFLINNSVKTKLKESVEYHFEILKAIFLPTKNIIQLAIKIDDEVSNYSEILYEEYDTDSSEFYELIERAIYPTEYGKIIEVNTEDFQELSGWCQVVVCGNKPKILISSIEPELSGVSSMQAYYSDI